eukprot:2367156-Pyramimonas_sp.AAC.1
MRCDATARGGRRGSPPAPAMRWAARVMLSRILQKIIDDSARWVKQRREEKRAQAWPRMRTNVQ